MSLIYHAFLCATIAYVYAEILTEGGMILNRWYKLLERRVGRWPFIFKPLIDCSKCVAGQVALWSYPLVYKPAYFHTNELIYSYSYSVFEHVACICMAILLTLIIKSIYTKFIAKWLQSN